MRPEGVEVSMDSVTETRVIPVQLPDDHGGRAAGAAVGEQLLQGRAVCVFTGVSRVLVDADLLGGHGRVSLQDPALGVDGDAVGRLLLRGYAGISETVFFHQFTSDTATRWRKILFPESRVFSSVSS